MDIIDVKNFKKNKDYLRELSKYKFNLCPEGNNFESHRIWESLIFKCTPIVEKNTINNNFLKLGIPLLVLESFSDLNFLKYEDILLMNKPNENKNYEIFTSLRFWETTISNKV